MAFRIWRLIVKEFIQLMRDRVLAPLVLLGPLLELLMVAWSTSQGIDHLPTAILDLDMSQASRNLAMAIDNTETFEPYHVHSQDEIAAEIEQGRAMAAWVIPRGFQQALLGPAISPASLQLIVDGADILAAQAAAEAADGLVERFGYSVSPIAESGATAAPVPLVLSLRVWFNEEMKESNYMIPSELGFIAAAVAAMIASMGIARERELGTLEQLMVTPIRSLELVIGKSFVAILLGYVEFLLMLGMVVWFFDLPLRGSLSLLMVIAFFYMLVELGWGLMISAVARTQMQALLIAFAVIMVMVIFSGYAFPVDTMPPMMQTIANLFPLKHWLVVFRAILLKGVGLADIWRELMAIGALGVFIYAGTVIFLRRAKLE